jgi:hypothetical protein
MTMSETRICFTYVYARFMPSTKHESYIEMFRRRPEFAAEFNDVTPTEYRADTVVSLATDHKQVFAVRAILEDMMTAAHKYHSDFARKYYDEGEAKGEANAVLILLATRGIEVSDDERTRILTCTDLDQLGTWIRRAATATTVDDLFG